MKKLILALSLISSIANAGVFDGYHRKNFDGYKEFHPEYDHPDVGITKVYENSLRDLQEHYKKVTGGRGEHRSDEVLAFAVLHTNNTCTIYTVQDDKAAVYIAHEEKHCRYGRWHD